MIRKVIESSSWGWTRSDRISSALSKYGRRTIHSICWTMARDSFWVHFGAWSKSKHQSRSGPWYERAR